MTLTTHVSTADVWEFDKDAWGDWRWFKKSSVGFPTYLSCLENARKNGFIGL